MKCQMFQGKPDSLLFERTAFPEGLELSCASWNLTLIASFAGSQLRGKGAPQKKKGKYIVTGQPRALFYVLQGRLQWKTRGAEHFFLRSCWPDTGNWRVEISPAAHIQFETTHSYCTYATPNREGICVLQLLSASLWNSFCCWNVWWSDNSQSIKPRVENLCVLMGTPDT